MICIVSFALRGTLAEGDNVLMWMWRFLVKITYFDCFLHNLYDKNFMWTLCKQHMNGNWNRRLKWNLNTFRITKIMALPTLLRWPSHTCDYYYHSKWEDKLVKCYDVRWFIYQRILILTPVVLSPYVVQYIIFIYNLHVQKLYSNILFVLPLLG